MKKITTLLSLTFFLYGCAGLQTLSKYDNTKPVRIDVDGKCYSVTLPPTSSTAYVDECPAASVAKSAIEGFTFGLYDSTPPKESHEKALKIHLQQQGKNCDIDPAFSNRIGDGMGGSYGYEVSFKCEN
jgi:hypothetical protein